MATKIRDKIGNNSACAGYITEILARSRGFSCSGDWMMSEKFHHDRHLLPWQRNLAQNRLQCSLYHRLRAVVTMTSKVNGKTRTLTPCRSESPENFITKIGHIDYDAGGNTHAKFYGNRSRGVRPTNSQNITSCDFVYLPFPSLSFFFLSSPTAKTDGRISSINTSNDAFSAKDVPFGGEKI